MIITLSKAAFWDINIEDLDPVVHADFIIRKVFDYGTVEDVNEVLHYYPEYQIVKSLTSAPYIDKKTLFFVCNYFNISPEDFKCYSKIQSAQNALSF